MIIVRGFKEYVFYFDQTSINYIQNKPQVSTKKTCVFCFKQTTIRKINVFYGYLSAGHFGTNSICASIAMGKTMKAMKSTPAKGKVKKLLGKGEKLLGKGSQPASSKPPLRKGISKAPLLKGHSSKKKPLPKGKGHTSKKQPLPKGSTKAQKGILKGSNLNKLGSMTWQDKVKKVTETAEDEEEAANQLVKVMTPGEKSRTWSKHQTWLKQPGNEEEKEEFEAASKTGKGQLTALFLMRKEGPKFCNVSRAVGTKQELRHRERWLSEKQANDQFGDDLVKHVESGRIRYRECATTRGTWEYLDTEDVEKMTSGFSERTWTQGEEYQQKEEEEESWEKMLDRELHGLLMENTPGKGALGKGSGKRGGKGGKGDRNTQKPLEDMAPEEQMSEGSKIEENQGLVQSTMTNYEEALEKVKAMQYLTKQVLKDKQAQLVSLEQTLEKVKKQLAKGDKGKLVAVKDLLKEAVSAIQEAKEEAKELVQISMRTRSQASKK